MKTLLPRKLRSAVLMVVAAFTVTQTRAADPLPSWNDTATKQAIVTFSDSLMAEANQSGWTVISMKDDWKTIFAFEGK